MSTFFLKLKLMEVVGICLVELNRERVSEVVECSLLFFFGKSNLAATVLIFWRIATSKIKCFYET